MELEVAEAALPQKAAAKRKRNELEMLTLRGTLERVGSFSDATDLALPCPSPDVQQETDEEVARRLHEQLNGIRAVSRRTARPVRRTLRVWARRRLLGKCVAAWRRSHLGHAGMHGYAMLGACLAWLGHARPPALERLLGGGGASRGTLMLLGWAGGRSHAICMCAQLARCVPCTLAKRPCALPACLQEPALTIAAAKPQSLTSPRTSAAPLVSPKQQNAVPAAPAAKSLKGSADAAQKDASQSKAAPAAPAAGSPVRRKNTGGMLRELQMLCESNAPAAVHSSKVRVAVALRVSACMLSTAGLSGATWLLTLCSLWPLWSVAAGQGRHGSPCRATAAPGRTSGARRS